MTPGRNDRCPCGSGKKYKHCCLLQEEVPSIPGAAAVQEVDDVQLMRTAAQHLQANRLNSVTNICSQILRQRPEHAEANHLLGLVAWRSGRHDQAARLLLRALRSNPRSPVYHGNFAGIRAEQGLHGEAIRAFRAALELQPEAPALRFGLGNQLLALGRNEEAVDAFERVLAAESGHPGATSNLAAAQLRLGRLDEAEQHAREADRQAPTAGAPQLTLAGIFRARGALAAAENALHEVLRRNPDYGEAYLELGQVLSLLGRHEEAARHLRTFLGMRPMDAGLAAQAVVSLHRDPSVDASSWQEAHEAWFRLHGPQRQRGRPKAVNDEGRPRRLACIIPDPGRSWVQNAVLPVLRVWARTYGDVYIYHGGDGPNDDHAIHWQHAVGLDEEGLAERLVQDGVDVVIDLLGHLAVRNGPGIVPTLLRRPAPLVVSWGYPGTLAAPGLYDAIVADDVQIPASTEYTYVEPVVRLGRPAVSWRGADNPVATDRERQEGPVTFLCRQGAAAINEEMLTTWAQLLSECPDTVLSLVHPDWRWAEVSDALRRRASAAGIPGARLEVAGSFQASGQGDIVLDTLPVSAGSDLALALWAGRPAVTMVGPLQVGRTGAAVLCAAGHAEWVAEDRAGYIAVARALAEDTGNLEILRRTLPEQLMDTPLCDAEGLAHALDEQLTRLWRNV